MRPFWWSLGYTLAMVLWAIRTRPSWWQVRTPSGLGFSKRSSSRSTLTAVLRSSRTQHHGALVHVKTRSPRWGRRFSTLNSGPQWAADCDHGISLWGCDAQATVATVSGLACRAGSVGDPSRWHFFQLTTAMTGRLGRIHCCSVSIYDAHFASAA